MNVPARSSIKTFAIIGLLTLFSSGSLLRAQSKATGRRDGRPNVILVMTDDQGYGDIGALGNTMIHTPNLDMLHSQSVRLTDFHVDPTCSPTRSALMSGRYSTRTGVWHTIMGRSLMAGSELTIAEVFRANGYRTGMYGKWHLGENFPLRPQDQGFEDVVCHGGGGVGQGPDYWGNDYFDDTYWRNGVPEKFKGYCTDVWFQEAMRFVAQSQSRDQPFFCYLSTNAPHGPLNVAEKWSKPYVEKGVAPNQAKFYGMIENIDWNVGRIMQQLTDLGIADNTILVFMTDNGTANGRVNRKLVQEGKWGGFNAGMRGSKGSEYDGGHRVPFFVRWPASGLGGATGSGRDEGYLAAHIDVLPTLVGLCGLAKPAGPPLDGIDLAGRLRDPAARLPERTLFVHSQRILHPKKWRKSAVMTERWRLVNGKQLFDMAADPGQKTDVATDHKEVTARLTAAYDAWWDSLAPAIARSVHIGLGSATEKTALLHPHDWQVIGRGGCPWHQNHVRNGYVGNGPWAIEVERAGEYEVTLYRWPAHVERAMDAVHAAVAIGGASAATEVDPSATSASFRLRLPAGPTELFTTLRPRDGEEHGAYFASVRRLGE